MRARFVCRCSASSLTGPWSPSSHKGWPTRARSLRVGDPLLAETEVGPLIRPQEVARVHAWVQEAAQQGAKVALRRRAALGDLLRADRAVGAPG